MRSRKLSRPKWFHPTSVRNRSTRSPARLVKSCDSSALRNVLVAVTRIDADRVHHGLGLGVAEFAEFDPRHDDPRDLTVDLGDQRDAHRGFLHRLGQLALVIGLPVAPGDAFVDVHDGGEVAWIHRADRHAVARQRFEIVTGRAAVIEFD